MKVLKKITTETCAEKHCTGCDNEIYCHREAVRLCIEDIDTLSMSEASCEWALVEGEITLDKYNSLAKEGYCHPARRVGPGVYCYR